MLKSKWVLRGMLMALALLTVSFAVFLRPPPVMGGIGCTGVRDSIPMPDATCKGGGDETCYECERSYDGGADIECSESPDGQTSYCLPYGSGGAGDPRTI